MDLLVVVIGFVLLGLGYLAYASYFRALALITPFRELASRLGCTGTHWRGWTGVHNGIRYLYFLRPVIRYSRVSGWGWDYLKLRVRISGASDLKFHVSRETSVDRFWKKIGVATHKPTGNTDFDRKFLVDRQGHVPLASFFADQNHLQALAAIMERGFGSVTGDGVKLEAFRDRFSMSHHFNPELITVPVENLARLVEDRARSQAPLSLSIRDRLDCSQVYGTLSAIVFVLALAYSQNLVNQYPPVHLMKSLLVSLSLSIPFLGLLAWCLFRWIRARKWSARTLSANLLGALFAIPFCCWAALVALNGKLDHQPATSHVVRIYDRIRSKPVPLLQRGETRHYLVVQSWHDPDAREKIPVNARMAFDDIEDRYLLKITTGAGRFGIEWKQSLALVEKPAATTPR